MVWTFRLAAALFVIALPLFLVTTNVRFLAGEVRFYERGFRVHDSDAATGLPFEELDRAAQEIIDYFENDASTLRIVVNDNGEEVSLFNTRETDHMKDVKDLMQVVFRANEVSLAYVLAFIAGVFLWAGQGSLRKLAWLSLGGVATGVAVVALVGLFALLGGFESTWDRFHELVFTNDFWQLNPATDRLIQMFPEPFWAEATFIVGALTIAEALAIVTAAVACLVFGREDEDSDGALTTEPQIVRATRLRARRPIRQAPNTPPPAP